MKKITTKGIVLNPTTTFAQPRPTRAQVEEENRFRAEMDLRTLRQAEEIRRDSRRMNNAKSFATAQVKAVSRASGRKK